MKIHIAGAGIGGLTAAACLQQAGHDVTVFERAKFMSEIGAGIQCGANALHVLDSLGSIDDLRSLAVEPERLEIRNGISGKTLYQMVLGEAYQNRYQQPYLHLHRADLQQWLRALLPHGCLRFSHHVTGYKEFDDKLVTEFENGSKEECDLLVVADGVRSKLRSTIGQHHQPRYSGYVAWRALVETSRLPADWMPKIVTNFVGAGKHAVLYYVRQQEYANLVGVVEDVDWQHASRRHTSRRHASRRHTSWRHTSWRHTSWTQQAPKSMLVEDFNGWHPMVTELIAAVDEEQCFRWALHQQPNLDHWVSQRVALLGDAAHAMLPFLASGAAMAIEDARLLQRCVALDGPLEKRLARYEVWRKSRVDRVQRQSARAGKLYHLDNPIVQKIAFASLPMVARRNADWLSDYNANTVDI